MRTPYPTTKSHLGIPISQAISRLLIHAFAVMVPLQRQVGRVNRSSSSGSPVPSIKLRIAQKALCGVRRKTEDLQVLGSLHPPRHVPGTKPRGSPRTALHLGGERFVQVLQDGRRGKHDAHRNEPCRRRRGGRGHPGRLAQQRRSCQSRNTGHLVLSVFNTRVGRTNGSTFDSSFLTD